MEIWKDIPDYEGHYEVSSLGRVKSLRKIFMNRGKYPIYKESRIMCLSPNKDGYLCVRLIIDTKRKNFKAHQLVAMAFLNHTPCGLKLVVNHKNFIRTDNRVENLEIITHRENSNKKHIKSSSKYIGVCWDKRCKKWISKITINRKHKTLGYFTNEIDAHSAYQNALNSIIIKK